MNVESTKLELMQLLLNTQREHVLIQLKEIFEQESEHESSLRREMIASAKRSNEDIEAGRCYTTEEVDALLEKRFGKE